MAQAMTFNAVMNESLATLLRNAIDYAGTFPPARLSLEQAAANYLQYRTSAAAWLLGRFVCAPSQLRTLPKEFASFASGGGISVVVEGADDTDGLMRNLDAALEIAAASAVAGAVDVLEVRGPGELLLRGDADRFGNAVQVTAGYAAEAGLGRTTLYFELPSPTIGAWAETLRDAASALADYNRGAGEHGCRAGFKVRTGGLAASAIPSSSQLAEVVVACRDYGVFWKATAGLHWPVRRFDPALGAPTHGFVNLFAATALAEAHESSAAEIAAVLDDDRPDHFRFTTAGFSWCGKTVAIERLADIRRRGLRSFGSCSFTEPLEGLEALFI